MSEESFPMVPSARPYLVLLLFLAALAHPLEPWLAAIPALLFFFITYFFRNPRRTVRATEGKILAPADGVIRQIRVVADDPFIRGPAVRLSIFLSTFNVHANRSPVAGRFCLCQYRPGKFLFPAVGTWPARAGRSLRRQGEGSPRVKASDQGMKKQSHQARFAWRMELYYKRR